MAKFGAKIFIIERRLRAYKIVILLQENLEINVMII